MKIDKGIAELINLLEGGFEKPFSKKMKKGIVKSLQKAGYKTVNMNDFFDDEFNIAYDYVLSKQLIPKDDE